ncbi:proline hydroxylase [Sphingomonas sp. ABOLD]|uniref:Rps23 Pro-64 3,4-dihydroxylase Tpa1-like proline 4-hydroxylase n=1 Tax=Sphingomonas trueperi TaxID=53317 RepID=A0A7X6BDU5_9SPHN|nr:MULTISPECIES: 2OG-Fe(II) oxygenase family protein [Sphingomonas]NJB98117.1 Rps23 Pro-64 3,4-dihydroxylase Tpa1-like proline 4-hydroxylase [Sphingomonas trueperi]RSV46390.1 proline hydroxylase [Sphingomonas sp. ABOLD]
MQTAGLALHSDFDIPALAQQFDRDHRVRLGPFLAPESAQALFEMLRRRTDWRTVVNSGDKPLEFGRETRASMSDAQRRALDDAVYSAARDGFQYRYETLRVPDESADRLASEDPLAHLAHWMSSDPVRTLLRQITAMPEIDFVDLQGTAYGPGDFLTGHDDAVPGKHRHAAYVLGLTPVWRAEWGGLLLFHDANGSDVRGYVPAFNVLTLFKVPKMHSVSEVSRAAAIRRYSITGWLRSRR